MCAGCGKCCQVMILDGIPIDRRTRMDRSFVEWIALHGGRTEIVRGAKGVSLTATVPTPCSKLQCRDGAYRCGIYAKRPYMCRDYSCLEDDGIGDTAWKLYIREKRTRA
ncbi:MAG: YkgJ family cysteine cluster protein [Deltaproteobacteria bacterium]|nr:YkgJ family cysteine cluster protein [Deltaproteobacteria bacterium]